MLMDNGKEKQEVLIAQSNKGLLIPMVWHEMHDFSEDCILWYWQVITMMKVITFVITTSSKK